MPTRDLVERAIVASERLTAAKAAFLDAAITSRAATGEAAAALAAVAYTRQAGVAQVKATTIDLNQAVASYTLFTGTTQVVVVDSLVIKCPNDVAAGALTSISIQTNDVTPGVFITAVQGAVANLTAEAQIPWTGCMYITVGKLIQLTIGGGAEGAAYVCSVVATYHAVVAGGVLA